MSLWLASALVADCISSGSLVYYLVRHSQCLPGHILTLYLIATSEYKRIFVKPLSQSLHLKFVSLCANFAHTNLTTVAVTLASGMVTSCTSLACLLAFVVRVLPFSTMHTH